MKKIILFLLAIASLTAGAQVTTVPSPPEADGPVTIHFNKSGTGLASYNGNIYAHIGLTVDGVQWQYVIGSWGSNATQPLLTGSGNNYSLTLAPDLYTYFGVPASSTITQICVVFRSASGMQQTVDYFIPVGAFQMTLNSPAANSVTLLAPGADLNVSASNTGGDANYTLFANGVAIHSANGISNYSFNHANITTNQNYVLEAVMGSLTITRSFSVIVNPGTVSEAMPSGLEDGINYNLVDHSRAILVLDAPGKDYIYVAGSFNNWTPGPDYAMKKDPASGKFWLQINGLTPQEIYTYQYWVVDATPIAQSPALVKTADPYSTLVLSPFDDQWIPSSSYPDLPPYPEGQEREVTVLQTGQTPYNWQVTDFVKPKKEDLVVYELLIRDFDLDRNFQSLINRIQYFKDLKVNAIQLMPIMEFEGNESWGYNTSFHLAHDKFYGRAEKLKEFIDLCHQNGIAVILDVALNHAFGRNPLVRMWMKDPDGDGWGDPAADSPYFNQFATHSYSVGSDFNHTQSRTKDYVKRVVRHWIEEFRIDGFRWDLTKGFTQNCAGSDACTNGYQQDRVDILKEYADYSWSIDPTHYVIFEHLGADNEEKEWANYRLNETPSKGVMMWSEMTYQYGQLAMGYPNGGDISRIGHQAHAGFNGKRVMGYPESHDKERIMYSAMTYGDPSGATPLNNLGNALQRMSSVGATSLLVPGPKMLWQFAELGYNLSIYTCANGSVNTESDAIPGDCKLDTKPQPQWANNWPADPGRAQVFSDYSKLIDLKINEPVFEGSYAISPDGTNLRQRIYVWDDALAPTSLKNVVVLANFSVNAQNFNPSFPYAGTWYNLIDGTTIEVANTSATINIPGGQYRVYGNQPPQLSAPDFDAMADVTAYPNPSTGTFAINAATSKVSVYTLTGQLVRDFAGSSQEGHLYDISNLPGGLYLIKATDTSGRDKTIRLIKQ